MTIEKTTFQVEIAGEQQASAQIRRVGREMDALAAKAAQAGAAADKANAPRGRLESLLMKARQKGVLKASGIEVGPLQLGRQGFELNRGYLRSNGVGLGAAFAGAALAHGAGALLTQIADLRDLAQEWRHQGIDPHEVTQRIANRAGDLITKFTGAQAILKGALRIAGVHSDVIDEAIQSRFETDREQAARSKAEEAARAQRKMLTDAAQKMRDAANAEIAAQVRQALAQIDNATARELDGIKNESLPVGLNRAQAREFKELREAEAKRRGRERARNVEAKRKLLVGEGD